MVTRYGTAELFGYNFSGLTPQKIREFSAAHYKEIPCPFKPIAPGNPTPTCSKKGGVCSLRQYSRHADGTVAPIGPPVTTCPQRFLEQNLVFEWVGEILLGNPLPVVISEVPFLMSETEVPTEAQPSLARTRLQIRLVAKLKTAAETSETFCKAEVERMLKNSQTKVIMPVVALGLLKTFSTTGRSLFSDTEVRKAYQSAVRDLKQFLGHDVHIGAKYEDAYGMRMSRYSVLKSVDHLRYELLAPYTDCAKALCEWIPPRIKQHIDERLGIVPLLQNIATRVRLAEDKNRFVDLIRQQIDKTPANFEIFSFAVIKVHLEKFACKIYRDTRTASHDKGVDLSTNFGVVYQIKKLRLYTESEADRVYAELKLNFDSERLQDGNVILVIDDISKDVKKYLIDKRSVQSLSKNDLLKVAANFEEPEDRQRVLRIVYEEFRREYSSSIR